MHKNSEPKKQAFRLKMIFTCVIVIAVFTIVLLLPIVFQSNFRLIAGP